MLAVSDFTQLYLTVFLYQLTVLAVIITCFFFSCFYFPPVKSAADCTLTTLTQAQLQAPPPPLVNVYWWNWLLPLWRSLIVLLIILLNPCISCWEDRLPLRRRLTVSRKLYLNLGNKELHKETRIKINNYFRKMLMKSSVICHRSGEKTSGDNLFLSL